MIFYDELEDSSCWAIVSHGAHDLILLAVTVAITQAIFSAVGKNSAGRGVTHCLLPRTALHTSIGGAELQSYKHYC